MGTERRQHADAAMCGATMRMTEAGQVQAALHPGTALERARLGMPESAGLRVLQRTTGNRATRTLLARSAARAGRAPEAALRPVSEAEAASSGAGAIDVAKRGFAAPGADVPMRETMESFFGVGLGGVRAHTGPEAEAASVALAAEAYTYGNDIAFRSASPHPATVAHELTHVLQQRGDISMGGDAEAGASKVEASFRAGQLTAGLEPHLERGARSVVSRSALRVHRLATPLPQVTLPIDLIFAGVVAQNIATSTPINIPVEWPKRVIEYARSAPLDGGTLLAALLRAPSFRAGGSIMKLQPGAGAMTLDRTIFSSEPLSLSTYVHELVHVAQYGALGVTAFLVSYFGMKVPDIVVHLRRGLWPDLVKGGPHEAHAHAIERMFNIWHKRTFGANPDHILA